MALNSDIAFKFGCGRYIQERQAIENNLETELKRFGTKVLFICGENGIKAAGDKIKKALENSTVEYEIHIFTSTPCFENADELVELAKRKGCDMMCGVGGGVIGDTVKLAASRGNMPLIQIPTSSATCVATTPLSVMYDRNTHAHLGSLKLMKEADAVIVDMDIMITQPFRLFWAGVMDAMAKMIEITHRIQHMNPDTVPVGFDMAYVIAKETYAFYMEKYDAITEAIQNGEITKDFELAIFYAIGVTGIVSGVSKGSNQCALGHRFYEETRTYFYEEAKDFVHGELVAMGNIVQLAYDGLDYPAMIEMLKEMGLPTTFSEINIPVCEKSLNIFVDRMCASEVINDSSKESKAHMREALLTIYK